MGNESFICDEIQIYENLIQESIFCFFFVFFFFFFSDWLSFDRVILLQTFSGVISKRQ